MISKSMRITGLHEHSHKQDFGTIELSGDDGGFPCSARINVSAKELWHLRVGQELVVNVEIPERTVSFEGYPKPAKPEGWEPSRTRYTFRLIPPAKQ